MSRDVQQTSQILWGFITDKSRLQHFLKTCPSLSHCCDKEAISYP